MLSTFATESPRILTGILAHELAHHDADHPAILLLLHALTALGVISAGILTTLWLVPVVVVCRHAAMIGVSRLQEHLADYHALSIAPDATTVLGNLRWMQQPNSEANDGRIGISSHPPMERRIHHATKHVRNGYD